MITFVTLSPRRFMVLDVSGTPSGYHAGEGLTHSGYLFVNAKVIAGPVSWAAATKAATDHAVATKQVITYDAYYKLLGQRP